MIRLYPEQLTAQLHEGLRGCYLLFGNEPLLLQESQDHIRAVARQQDFLEHFSFTIDNNTDWDAIFSTCQALSLFASRQTLLLILPDAGPGAPASEQLVKLATLLHPDILLMVRGNKLTKAQENSAWFKALSQQGVYVPCMTPEQEQLPRWVAQRARNMKLALDDAASQLICYCYEGNMLALVQALERLSLLYPDGKLTLPRWNRPSTMPLILRRSIGWMPCSAAKANGHGTFFSNYGWKIANRSSCCARCNGSCCYCYS